MTAGAIGMIWVYRIPCIRPEGNIDAYPLVVNRKIDRQYIASADAAATELVRQHTHHNIVLFPTDQPTEAVEYARKEGKRIADASAGISDRVACIQGSEILYISDEVNA